MASTGKKGKKKNKTTLSLNDFLGDSAAPNVIKPTLDWADEADDSHISSSLSYQSSASKVITLPTAPRAARNIEIDQSRIPESGPFTAYVGNLPYDADQYMLEEFFKDISILNVRLPEENGRFKGFGYVQFAERQGLIKALQMNDETLERRTIRVDIAGNQKESGSTWGRSNSSSGGYRSELASHDGPDPTDGNWRKAATEFAESQPPREQRRGYGDRYDSGGYGRNNYDQDRGGYNDRNRGGGGYHSGGSRYGDRDSYNRGGDRYQKSNEPPRQRPQLNLQKRQKPIEENSPTTRSSSIFGSAKPVDTSAREKIIEEKISSQDKVVPEDHAPVKKSVNIFGDAKPVDTTAKEREAELKIAEQERLIFEKAQEKPLSPPPAPKASVFGAAKPVDTSARDREIEEKIRQQDEPYLIHENRDEYVPRQQRDRRSSERSDGGRSSPRRRSRTSSTRSSDGHEVVSPHVRKSSSSGGVDAGKKPEYKPAPVPKQNAWGRKLATGAASGSSSEASHTEPQKVVRKSSSEGNQWNRGPPKMEVRGEREEAEGNEEDEEEERRPEGAADEEESMQNRTGPGDGRESNERSNQAYNPRSSGGYNQRKPAGGRRDYDNNRQYNNRPRDYPDRQRSFEGRNPGRDENRRRGDGDSESYRNERRTYGGSDRRHGNNDRTDRRRDYGSDRRHDLDPRPECDRPDGAVGQEKPVKTIKSRRPPVKVVDEPIEFSTQSKFAMLPVEGSDDES